VQKEWSTCELCYHELRKKVYNSIYRYSIKHTIHYNKELAEESFNESLMEVLEDQEEFTEKQQEATAKGLPSYAPLLRIARKHYMKLLRQDSKSESLSAILDDGKADEPFYRAISNLYAKNELLDVETRETLKHSLHARQYRLALRILQGYSNRAIAELEKVSHTTINNDAKRIKEVLRS